MSTTWYSMCFSCDRTMIAHTDRDLVVSQAQIHRKCNKGHIVEVDTRPGASHCDYCGYKLTGIEPHGKDVCVYYLKVEPRDMTRAEARAA